MITRMKLPLYILGITFILLQYKSNAQLIVNAGTDDTICAGNEIMLGGNPTASGGSGHYAYYWSPVAGLNDSELPNPMAQPLISTTYHISIYDSITQEYGYDSVRIAVNPLPDPSFTTIPADLLYCTNGAGAINFVLTLYNISSTQASNAHYHFDWGDGTFTDTVNYSSISHTYYAKSFYYLQLTVSGSGPDSCTATKSDTLYIGSPPVGSLYATGPTNGCAPLAMAFAFSPNIHLNPPGTIYRINFDDGSPELLFNYLNVPDTLYHTFLESSCGHTSLPGPVNNAYSVKCSIQNPCATVNSFIQPVMVSSKPNASFSHFPNNSGCIDQIYHFYSTTDSGGIVSYVNNQISCNSTLASQWSIIPSNGWNLVNGNLEGSSQIQLQFTTAGIFTIRLFTWNTCGADTAITTLCIVPAPVANFSINTQNGCKPLYIHTSNNSSTGNVCGISSREWSIIFNESLCDSGSGSYTYIGGTNPFSLNPYIRFNQSGVYTLRLTIQNSCGSSFFDQQIVVKGPPIVEINPVPDHCSPAVIYPTATFTSCYSTINDYLWTFENGIPIYSENEVPGAVSYSGYGEYDIIAMAENECGTRYDTLTFNLIVSPIIVSGPPNMMVCPGQTLGPFTFVTDPPDSPISWLAYNGPQIGLSASSGTGTIPAFTIPPNNTGSFITATIIATPGSGSCPQASDTVYIFVSPSPSVNAGPALGVCISAPAIQLTGNQPTGGTWSGPGVSPSGVFTPWIAGSGAHGLTYSYASPVNGCIGSADRVVTVFDLPTVDAGIDTTVCLQSAHFILSGVPAGGIWSGSGVSPNGLFTPVTLGIHWLVYTFIDPLTQCSAFDSLMVTVVNPPDVYAGNDIILCLNSPPDTLLGYPLGGYWTGPHVTQAGIFHPVSPGNNILLYHYNGNCSVTDTLIAFVSTPPVLTTSPDISIPAGSSTTLNASASGGHSPYQYEWSNGMSGPSIVVSPASSSIFIVTVTDAYGCQDSDTVMVTVYTSTVINTLAPTINLCPGNIVIPINVNNCEGVGSISLTLNYNPSILTFSGYQNPHPELGQGMLFVNSNGQKVQLAWFSVTPANIGNGTLIEFKFSAVQGSSALSWDLQTQGACQYTDTLNNNLPSAFIDGNVIIGSCSNITGIITYDNAAHTPLSNVHVILRQNGGMVDQTITNTNGEYTFMNLPNGSYTLESNCQKPWGGVNAADALLVMRYFVDLYILAGLRLEAADVDASGYVNANDALLIAKRFVGIIPSFVAGDWIFENQTVTITGTGNMISNYKGLCVGDVDGSYIPVGKTEPFAFLETRGRFLAEATTFSLSILSEREAEIGSASIVLKFPGNIFTVNDISSPLGGQFIYSVANGEIRIAWYDEKARKVSPGDLLAFLSVTVTNQLEFNSFILDNDIFQLDPVSQVSDANGRTIVDFLMSIPKVIQGINVFSLGQNIPNPTGDVAEIQYSLAEDASVCFTVFDHLGQKVAAFDKGVQASGVHLISMNTSLFSPGVYTYVLTANGMNSSFKAQKKMVIAR